MTAAPHPGDREGIVHELDELYPGRWALLLVPVCNRDGRHQHDGKRCQHPGKVVIERGWNALAVKRWTEGIGREERLAFIADNLLRGGNVGLVIPPGIVALDGDTAQAAAFLERALPDAPAQATAKGQHVLARVPLGLALDATVKLEVAPGVRIDVRSAGRSQIVVAPSVHPTGAAYSWRRELPEDWHEIPDCPPVLLEVLMGHERTSTAGTSGDKIGEGGRNDYLFRVACGMRSRGLSEGEIRDELHRENERRCAPPLERDEVEAIVASAMRHAAGASEQETPQPPRLRVLTAEEFEADVAPSAIVKTMIYEGSTHSMNGASKAGKTWAALQLAMAANAGEPFVGLGSVASPVLYLSFELSAGMLRSRMREIEAGTEIPFPRIGDTFHVIAPTASYVPALDLGAQAGIAELERIIRETGARLVIADTLYRFLPGCDPNDNGEMGLVYGRMNDLAQRSGAALLLLDHVGKGDQLGPVSHSALGASVKGGAARVVIALRRTSREDGGRWQLDVESHFGSWEEPVYYERPTLPDGTRGGGCIPCSASEAHGMKLATVHQLFRDFGQRDANGHAYFPSKRKLIEALEAAKLASGNAQGQEIVAAIQRDYAIPDYLADRHLDRPILTREGDRRAVIFTWRMAEMPESREDDPW